MNSVDIRQLFFVEINIAVFAVIMSFHYDSASYRYLLDRNFFLIITKEAVHQKRFIPTPMHRYGVEVSARN